MAENKNKDSKSFEEDVDANEAEAVATPVAVEPESDEDPREVAAKEAHVDESDPETGPDVSFAREV